jgi:hypothetical protein
MTRSPVEHRLMTDTGSDGTIPVALALLNQQ